MMMNLNMNIQGLKAGWQKCRLSILVFMCAAMQSGPVLAQIDASRTKGCALMVVNFKPRQAFDAGSKYTWNLGRGPLSYDYNPIGVYPDPGTYNVTLTIEDAAGNKTSYTETITVNAPPKIDFGADDREGCFPHTVNFNDLSVAGSGTIKNRYWFFGDGNSASDIQNPTNKYTKFSAPYSVTLRVVQSTCEQDTFTLTKPGFVVVNEGVRPDFYVVPPTVCKPPVNIQIKNLSQAGAGQSVSYTWTFENGTPATSTSKDPVVQFSAAGEFKVTLVARSSAGCEDTKTDIIKIPSVSVYSDFTPESDTICQGKLAGFQNNSYPSPDSSFWYFGNDPPVTGVNQFKVFSNTGMVDVKLVNKFGSCRDSVTKRIFIQASPDVKFTSNERYSCKAPHTVNFTYSGSSPTSITQMEWEFGDGNKKTETGLTTSHTYANVGSYPVKLTVTNKFGCTISADVDGFVVIKPPKIDDPKGSMSDSGCVNHIYRPNVTVDAPDGVAKYEWDFGDGTTGVGQNVSHAYGAAQANPYMVKLTVTTNLGCTVTQMGQVRIGVPPGPSEFEATPREVCTGEVVKFRDRTGSTTAPVTGWLWEYGNNAVIGRTKDVDYVFGDTGTFDIKLYVYNNGCTVGPTEKKKYIKVTGPISKFKFETDCDNKSQFIFRNFSENADEYEWDFKDGSPILTMKDPPPHTFPANGFYEVTLTAKKGGCKMSFINVVTVINENPGYTYKSAFSTSFCTGTTIIFDAINIDPRNVKSYEWDFGDGNFILRDRNTTNSYPLKGIYNTRLRITDMNGCKQIVAEPPFAIGGPKAGLDADIRQGCKGLVVNFRDTSIAGAGSTIRSRFWSFGDGITENKPPDVLSFPHKYTDTGAFTVKLRVTDEKGCEDSMILKNYITVSDPIVKFSADRESCPGKMVKFTNQTKMKGGIYNWDFGDGQTSNLQEPVNIYQKVGTYDVKLKVRDINGCEAADSQRNYITIGIPVADYDLNQSFSRCPPLTPGFTLKASYYRTIKWEFGDGGISDKTKPDQIYLYPGKYLTKLTVTSPGGCIDTASKMIEILGPSGNLVSDKLEGCDTMTVNFRLKDYSDVDSIIWDFDDGARITKQDYTSHTYLNPGFYKPRVILKNQEGCKVQFPTRDTMKVIGIDPGFISADTLNCDKATVKFRDTSRTNGTLASWSWDFGDGGTSTLPNPTHVYTSPGAYEVKLKVSTTKGCTDQQLTPQYIRIVRSPVGEIISDPSVCQESQLIFRGTDKTVPRDTSILKWQWDFGNGQISDLQDPPAQTFRAFGDYIIRAIVTNSTGCRDTVEKPLKVFPLPNMTLTPDSTICLGQAVSLTATGASSYEWLAPVNGLSCINCANPVAKPDITTRYVVRGKSSSGCLSTDTTVVTVVQPSLVSAVDDASVCIGGTFQLNASGTQTYFWTPATGLNNPNIPNPIAKPTVSTTYYVRGSDNKGCFPTFDSVRVTVYPYPSVNAGPDVVITSGSTNLQLKPTFSNDVRTMKWTPADGLSCTDCPNPFATPKTNTSYTLTVTNGGGCESRDALTVTVVCEKSNLFMPNTFSPNGDGMNDVYYPRGRGIQTVRSLKIFNRWGEQVFRRENFNANDAAAGWDGRFNGKELVPDVYVYIIDLACDNKTIVTQKGDVALIR
jgi:gliding motility-associated-like protein